TKAFVALSRVLLSCESLVACALGYASSVHCTYRSHTSRGSSDSAMLAISSSYSARIRSLTDLVSESVGGEGRCARSEGEKTSASFLAERPLGSAWMFSFCSSITSKLIRSSDGAILSTWVCTPVSVKKKKKENIKMGRSIGRTTLLMLR